MNLYKLANLYYKLANDEISSLPEETFTVPSIKTINQISESLKSDQKIIISKKPMEGFIGKRVTQSSGSKPKGIWYSCGNDWIRFSIDREWLPAKRSDLAGGDYIYEIELDKENMKRISNIEELINFSMDYEITESIPTYARVSDLDRYYPEIEARHARDIDWNAVAKYYSGIEICPYIYQARHKIAWYYDWDVASGCIWNNNAFKSIKLLAKRTEGEDAWEVYE